MHLTLKAKFGILTGASVLAVAVLLTTVLTLQQERTIRQELLNRAIALTENLAYNCQLPLAAENQQSLHRLAQGLFKQSEVTYVRFKNSSGVELHSEAEGKGWPFEIVDVKDQVTHPSGTLTSYATAADGHVFLDVQTVVAVEGGAQGDDILSLQRQGDAVVLGTVNLGLSTEPAQALIARARTLGSLLGIAVALMGSLLASTFIRVMTRPLGQLMEGNRRVARGDFSLRLAVHSRDEFGRLAGSYNQMADEIQRSRELAESYHASLRSNAEHLEEANRALQESNAELAKASRMKSEFLAVTSHELRTPLNVIIGFSEVLLDGSFGGLNPKQHHYVENVLTSGRHLLSIINDILDLSKVEAGRMKVTPEPFDLRQLADEIQGLVRELAAKKGITIHFEPAPALTPVTDQKLFKQVMLNLLSNAIKFTPSGGRVDLTIRCIEGRSLRSDASTRTLSPERRLGITARRVLVVEVRDNGVGIPTEEQERIFTAFQQVDASYSRQQEGTGLGLALTRRIVHLLGGDIWFTSAAKEGSTFWFYVPFEFQENDASREAAATSAAYSPAWGTANPLPAVPRLGSVATEDDVATESAASRVDANGTVVHADWPWGGEPEQTAEEAADAGARPAEGDAAASEGRVDPNVVAGASSPVVILSPKVEVLAATPADSPAALAPVPAAVEATGEPVGAPPQSAQRSRRGKKSRKKDRPARPTAGDGAPGGDTP